MERNVIQGGAGEVALKVFEAMNGRDLTGLSTLLAPDGVFHFPGTEPLVGPEVIGRFLKILLRRFPALRFETERVIEQGESAAVEWRNRGEDRKGEPYENAGVTVIEMKDGRISYMSDTFKDTSVFSR
ncbi:MAG: nuclear transport factor 2 family protein [Planctomycetota bacterium]|jgi:ketosteroid isomerase-like protein